MGTQFNGLIQSLQAKRTFLWFWRIYFECGHICHNAALTWHSNFQSELLAHITGKHPPKYLSRSPRVSFKSTFEEKFIKYTSKGHPQLRLYRNITINFALTGALYVMVPWILGPTTYSIQSKMIKDDWNNTIWVLVALASMIPMLRSQSTG